MATGIVMGGLFSTLIVKGIDAFGWQNLMLYMGISIVFVGLPLSFIFHDKPQDLGLMVDGQLPNTTGVSTIDDPGITLKQALRTRTLWQVGSSQMLQTIVMNSVTVHLISYLTSLGVDRTRAAVALTIFSVVSVGVRLLYGLFADVFPKRYVAATSCAITSIAVIILGSLDGSSYALVVTFAVIYAVGAGGLSPLRAPIIREYFGTRSFGSIFGVSIVLQTIGSSISPPVTGWVYDTRGTYYPIWFIYAGLTILATVLAALLPKPRLK